MIIDTKQAKRTNESTTKIMSERRGGIQSFVIVDIGRRRSLLTSWTEHLHKYVWILSLAYFSLYQNCVNIIWFDWNLRFAVISHSQQRHTTPHFGIFVVFLLSAICFLIEMTTQSRELNSKEMRRIHHKFRLTQQRTSTRFTWISLLGRRNCHFTCDKFMVLSFLASANDFLSFFT